MRGSHHRRATLRIAAIDVSAFSQALLDRWCVAGFGCTNSCSVSAFTFMSVPVGLGEGKVVGVGELVGASVLVGITDGAGAAVFAAGLTIIGVATGRLAGVRVALTAATASVTAGAITV